MAVEMDRMWGDAAGGDAVAASRVQWLRDGKYSMFIHWGLYSHLGGVWKGKTYRGVGEWIMNDAMADIPVEEYRALAADFNPTGFDARALARLAKSAGMQCIVITAKHHEGFAMFDSGVSDFTIARATPFDRDPLRELAEACQEEGIRLGFYYSQFLDWTEPDGGGSVCPPTDRPADFQRYFEGKVVPQVTELLTNYGPIAVIWFDTPGTMDKAHSQRLVDLVHDLQPGCLVNGRVGHGLGDYVTLGDMEIPVRTPDGGGVCECVDTTNDSWSFSRHDAHWKSPATIVRALMRVAARGCCYMLNVGPKGDGTIPAEAVQALAASGRWVHANSEAIYGTKASPFPPFSWGDCTVRDKTLYVHVFDWPRNGQLRLSPMDGQVERAELLTTDEPIAFFQEGGLVTLELPPAVSNPVITVIRLTFNTVPAALHQDLAVDGQHTTHLLAEYAETAGVALRCCRWMEAFGEWKKSENLVEWGAPTSRAAWRVDVLEAGIYTVAVEYACTQEAEGSEWRIRSASDTVTFAALDTGLRAADTPQRPRMRYRTVEVGILRFGQAGRQSVDLSPSVATNRADIWVTRVILKPWV